VIGGILAASFEPPSTNDFVYGCWGPSIKIAGFDFCLNFIVFLVLLTTVIVLALFFFALRKPTTVPGKFQLMVELGVQFVRENIAVPMLGHDADTFMPLLTAFFFFILFSNIFVDGRWIPQGNLWQKLLSALRLSFTFSFEPHYSFIGASKAALESLARALAQELGSRRIRVNIVSAGVVDTDALKHFPNREELLAESLRRTPLQEPLTPAHVADAVYLLCQPEAALITGHTLVVDGGYCISG